MIFKGATSCREIRFFSQNSIIEEEYTLFYTKNNNRSLLHNQTEEIFPQIAYRVRIKKRYTVNKFIKLKLRIISNPIIIMTRTNHHHKNQRRDQMSDSTATLSNALSCST